MHCDRAVDTTRFKADSSAVKCFAQVNNLCPTTRSTDPAYRYEQDIQQFFHHSPAVVRGIDE